jgi:hypothetical protein
MYSFRYKHGDRPLDGYTIERAAGRGGFGEVYYALSDSGREVALKAVQGYEQIEVRGISQCMNLKSPHLVTIFDVKYNGEGRPFVIMEYVSGPSLRQLLDESPSGLGEQKSAFFLREIGKGLSFLHECGIVHRDLKPGNVFYENGYVKIGDYGLSKALGPIAASGQTVTVGTLHYMAPEIGAGKYDRSIDIYALGACLYEMLTGMVPFVGASPSEILLKHLSAEPDLKGISEPFATVIKKSMAKDPAARYQTVQEMVEAVFGSDHVRQSVSVFAPEELSVVAGRAAAKLPVGAGVGGGAGAGAGSSARAPGLGGPWAGAAGSSGVFAQPFRAVFGNRLAPLSSGLGARAAATAGVGADSSVDASDYGAAIPWQVAKDLDPMPRGQRTLLAMLIAMVGAAAAAAFSRHANLAGALFVGFGGAGSIIAMSMTHWSLLGSMQSETAGTRRLVVALAASVPLLCVAGLLSLGGMGILGILKLPVVAFMPIAIAVAASFARRATSPPRPRINFAAPFGGIVAIAGVIIVALLAIVFVGSASSTPRAVSLVPPSLIVTQPSVSTESGLPNVIPLWLAIVVPMVLFNSLQWGDPHRKERLRIWTAAGSGIIAAIASSFLEADSHLAAIAAGTIALGTNAIAPWVPLYARSSGPVRATGPAAPQTPAGAGAAVPAAAAGMGAGIGAAAAGIGTAIAGIATASAAVAAAQAKVQSDGWNDWRVAGKPHLWRGISFLSGISQAFCMLVIFIALILTAALALNVPESYVAAVNAGARPVRLTAEMQRWLGATGMDGIHQAQLLAHEAHHVGSILVAIMVALALTGIAIARQYGPGARALRGVVGPLLMFYAITLLASSVNVQTLWDPVVKQLIAQNGPAAMSAFTDGWDSSRACLAGVVYLAGILIFVWPPKRRDPIIQFHPNAPAVPVTLPPPPAAGAKTATL